MIEKELNCKLIRINPDEEHVCVFKALKEIQRHIQKSFKH